LFWFLKKSFSPDKNKIGVNLLNFQLCSWKPRFVEIEVNACKLWKVCSLQRNNCCYFLGENFFWFLVYFFKNNLPVKKFLTFTGTRLQSIFLFLRRLILKKKNLLVMENVFFHFVILIEKHFGKYAVLNLIFWTKIKHFSLTLRQKILFLHYVPHYYVIGKLTFNYNLLILRTSLS
jgi:hypothetical protein